MPISIVDHNGQHVSMRSVISDPTPIPTPFAITIVDHYLSHDTHNTYAITLDSTVTIQTLSHILTRFPKPQKPSLTLSHLTLLVTPSHGVTEASPLSISPPFIHQSPFPFPFSSFSFLLLPNLPKFAYLLTGTKGEVSQLKRVLQATYHPRNYYLLHLDLEASDAERLEVAKYVKSERVFGVFRNVMVVGKGDLVTYKGPSMIASTLHSVALFLKKVHDWDWFVNLSAYDYPLFSQDDLLHIFSFMPRDMNFIEHTSNMGWKQFQRARPIIIDPGLCHSRVSSVYYAKEKRSLPSSFKLFTGSEWVVLTKPFLEFCVWGWDNLPRTLLMYYTNFLSSNEGYFLTVICNHKDYQNTTVNHDLRYLKWDNPPTTTSSNLSSCASAFVNSFNILQTIR